MEFSTHYGAERKDSSTMDVQELLSEFHHGDYVDRNKHKEAAERYAAFIETMDKLCEYSLPDGKEFVTEPIIGGQSGKDTCQFYQIADSGLEEKCAITVRCGFDVAFSGNRVIPFNGGHYLFDTENNVGVEIVKSLWIDEIEKQDDGPVYSDSRAWLKSRALALQPGETERFNLSPI